MDLDDGVETGGSKLTCPGESLTSAQAFMRYVLQRESRVVVLICESRGHGTYVDNEEVISSVVGTVERVNKLVTGSGPFTQGGVNFARY